MKHLILVASLLLGGCASHSTSGYWSEYQVGPADGLSGKAAEEAHKSLVTTGVLAEPGKGFDSAPKLLRAPQPVMPPEDTEQRVTGEVTAQIYFNEEGLVERIVVVKSSKASLTEAVTRALSQWQMTPVTRDGKPVKLVVRQSFGFRPGW